jgi:outer membrane protein assembly factor BamB
MNRPILIAASVFACLASCCALRAQEWPRFRGPNGAGQSEATTIPVSWGPEEYLWKVALPGKGNASPILWGQRIFLISANPDEGTQHLLCHSARDGRLLWQRDYPGKTHRLHQQNTFASSTPAADAKHVYFAWATPDEFTLLALDHDGAEAWRLALGPFASQHGFGTSPIVYRDMVIVTNDQDGDSFLIAVDAARASIRWKAAREVLVEQNASYSAPCILRRTGAPDALIVVGRSHGVVSIDPSNGTTNWEARVLPRRTVCSPIVVDGLVMATSGNGAGANTMVAVEPPQTPGAEPKLKFQIDGASVPYVPTMVAKESLVFLWSNRGIVTCIDGATGKVHWRQRASGNYFSSPVRVADRIYGVSVDGDVVVLAASKEYRLLGRSSLGETTRATPAVAGGRMFLRTETHLLAVGQP